MPHLGHVTIFMTVEPVAGVLTDVVIGVLAISSRSGFDRLDTSCCGTCLVAGVEADVHTVGDIDPEEPSNMVVFPGDFELTQGAPQSFWLKDVA